MTKLVLFIVIFLLQVGYLTGQASQANTESIVWNLQAYLDAYFLYDFNQPRNLKRLSFLYNHSRHNEVNINQAVLGVKMNHAKFRSTIMLHAGTYVEDNYTNEPTTLKNLFEAQLGLSLHKKNKLWLDAGIFPSHIGFETALSYDNWTLSRSLMAENSPYYLSGVKLSWVPKSKVELAIVLCNGWQRIQKLSGNSIPSVGTQIKFKFGDQNFLNWSSFVGSDQADSVRQWRYFNNLFLQWSLPDGLLFFVGFDIGFQQKQKNVSQYNYWLTPNIMCRKFISTKWAAACRFEYFNDPAAIILSVPGPRNGNVSGFSINLDFIPFEHMKIRGEARYFHHDQSGFINKSEYTMNNFSLAFSCAYNLHHRM